MLRLLKTLGQWCLFTLLLTLVACGGSGSVEADISRFVQNLPSWQEISPEQEENDGERIAPATEPVEKIADNQVYSCRVERYSMTKNPEQIVMMNPNAGVIWPGALLHGESHLSAALRPLALDKSRRAPLGISVEGGGVLGVRAGVSTIIEQPVASTVREGINQLIANAIESDVAVGAGFSRFTSVESFSGTQATLALGLEGRYLGSSASASLNFERDANEYTYTAYFIQRLFTISVDLPESPAALFTAGTSAADLRAFGIGSGNLPLYISSVSYGRILMYSFTSSEERKKIEAALEFSYNAPGVGVDGYAAAELEETLQNAKIEILAIGGPNTGVVNLIREGNLASYFEAEIALNQVEPISFNIRNLGDNSLARVSNTTEYDVETCTALGAALPQPDHWWQGEGNADDEGGNGTFQNNLEYGAGRFGQAFALNGQDAYFAAIDEDTVFDSTAPFTISMWVNPRNRDGLEIFAAETSRLSNAGHFVLGKIKHSPFYGNMLFFQRLPNSGSSSADTLWTPLATADIVPRGVWTLVTAVYGGAGAGENNIRLFVNGQKVEAVPFQSKFLSSDFVDSDKRTRFGNGGYRRSDVRHYAPFNGLMDEIMTFNRALSDEEIKMMYENFANYKK